ncbi:MAG: TonB family protein [Acidobacteria bacterium]|nr:TonB family protein [Acidobacteriota bacterium]
MIRLRRKTGVLLLALLLALASHAHAAWGEPSRVAVLDFGDSASARRAADELADALRSDPALSVLSRAQSRAAARGVGYRGSLNLTLEDARSLGAAAGCDFFFAGDADTVRRSPGGARPDYFESYASLFLVSSHTGRLALWERLSAEASSTDAAEKKLIEQLRSRARDYASAAARARDAERAERHLAVERDTPVIEDAPGEGSLAAKDFRVPLPYRRLRPAYTDEAARDSVEATVDALVELDERGEVTNVEIARWAGYGLDESVARTIRQMHFRPALRAGAPVATRVLLRYNFRKPKVD